MTTREYAKNLFSAWNDDDFCDQPVFDKLLFQVLNGQRAVNAAGIQPINFTRWRKAMRDGDRLPTIGELKAALVRMERRGFVYTDEDTGEVLIRSRIRNDGLEKQPTVFLSALRLLAVIDSPKFAAVMHRELGRMVNPDIKGDSDHAKKLRTALDQASTQARAHLKALSEGYAEPYPEPFAEEYGIPNPEGYAIGYSRPGETGPNPIPNPEGSAIPSVSGSVSVLTSPLELLTGGTRAHAREADTDPTAPLTPSDEPPTDNAADPEPATRCRRHRALPADAEIPDCGPCANFRKAHDRWAERQRHTQAKAQSAEAHARAALIAEAIEACNLCDDDGYRNGSVCDHNPHRDDTNARGIAAVRAALTRTPDIEDEPDA